MITDSKQDVSIDPRNDPAIYAAKQGAKMVDDDNESDMSPWPSDYKPAPSGVPSTTDDGEPDMQPYGNSDPLKLLGAGRPYGK